MSFCNTIETSSSRDSLFATLVYERCHSHDDMNDVDSMDDVNSETGADDDIAARDADGDIAVGEPSAAPSDEEAAWRSFLRVVVDTIDRAIALLVQRVRGCSEDVAALQHLRAVVVARLNGKRIKLRMGELLHSLGVIFSTFIDQRIEGRAVKQLATQLRRLRDIAHEMLRKECVCASATCEPSRGYPHHASRAASL